MTLFELLLVGHFVGDFLFQTSWMAERKMKEWFPLVAHCAVYTAVLVFFAKLAGGVSPPAAALIFASHLLLDRRKFIEFWMKNVLYTGNNDWLKIILDQTCHLVVIVVAVFLSQ